MDTLEWDENRRLMIEETPEQWCPMLKVLEGNMAEHGFSTLKDFITTRFSRGGLGISLEKALQFIEYNPAYEHQAGIFRKTLGMVELAKSTGVGNPADTQRNSLDYKTENIMKTQGTSARYRIAKLKRDYPEIAKGLEDGTYTKVSQAERAAGIGRPLMSEVDKVVRAYERLSDEEKDTFRELTALASLT